MPSSRVLAGPMLRPLLRVACLMLAALACGGDAGNAGDPAPVDRGATDADVAAWCDATCEHNERCESEDDERPAESCRATCIADLGYGQLIQQRVAHAFRDCLSELSCDQSDDSCFALVAAELELDLTSPLAERCLSVQDDCENFIDDLCILAVVATPVGQTRLDQCLSSSCDAVPGCIEALGE